MVKGDADITETFAEMRITPNEVRGLVRSEPGPEYVEERPWWMRHAGGLGVIAFSTFVVGLVVGLLM